MDGLLAVKERKTETEREKITVNTHTCTHTLTRTHTHAHTHTLTHTHTYTHTQVLSVRRFSLFIKRHFIPSMCVYCGNKRRRERAKGKGEKQRAKIRECILSYICFYLIDGLHIPILEWAIIKMIEDSVFGFNTCHYFGQSFYLLLLLLYFFLVFCRTSPSVVCRCYSSIRTPISMFYFRLTLYNNYCMQAIRIIIGTESQSIKRYKSPVNDIKL